MTWHIREAVRRLGEGGVIAYPTETVFGLGCDPFNAQAVLRVLDLKQRDIEQGVILIASDFAYLEPLLLPLSTTIRTRILETWPGPVTWTLPCLPEIPEWLRGSHRSLAVRLTSHPLAHALCESWNGPLVSTSANLHGKPPATSALGVRMAFNAKLDYILHGQVAGTGRPSEIRDGITGRVLRDTVPVQTNRGQDLQNTAESPTEMQRAVNHA
jgi:L-threonylcarbamoyladenylate synthase